MKKQIVSIFLVICMLACLLPSGIFVSAAADFSMSEKPIFLTVGDVYNFGGGDSITWSCDGDNILLSDSGHVIAMDPGLSIVRAVRDDGVSFTCPVYVSETVASYAFSDVGAALFNETAVDLTTITSYEASQVDGVTSAEWMYVDGNTAATYDENGLQFFEPVATSVMEYLQFKIKVEDSGNYLAMLPYTPSVAADVFLAPADAVDATADEYHLFATAGAGASTETLLQSKSVLSLEAGEYLLTFAKVYGSSLRLDAFKLFRVSDLGNVADSLSLSCPSAFLLQGDLVQSSVSISPKNLSNVDLVYYSKDPSIISVDTNGQLSANAIGTTSVCVICKNNPLVSDSLELTVKPLSEDYQFAALAEKLATDYPGVVDLKNDATISQLLQGDCSALIPSSAPFTFVDMSSACSYDADAPENGISFFSASAEEVTLKITVSEDGQYLPLMISTSDANSAGVSVSIESLTDDVSKTSLLSVSNDNLPTDGTVETVTRTTTPINLKKGEYYLTISKADEDATSFRIKNLRLYRLGDIPAESVSISGAPASMERGKTVSLSASVFPKIALQDVTWSSSSERLATVENGVVTAHKPGVVTITAASVENPSVLAKVDIKITGANYIFDFLGTAAVSYADNEPNNKEHIVKTVDTHMTYAHAEEAGSDPLCFKKRVAYNSETWSTYRYYNTTDVNGNACGMFLVQQPYNAKSVGLFEIQIDEPGVYSAELFYSSYYGNQNTTGALYITSTSVTDAELAISEENLLINIPDADASKVTKGHVVTASGNVNLAAGTYNLWYVTDAPNNGATLGYAPIDVLNLYKISSVPVSISLSAAPEKIARFEKATLTAVVEPATESQDVIWKSSDTSVATVDANGVVTALDNGTATITATWASHASISKSVTVTVSGPTVDYNFNAVGKYHYDGSTPVAFDANEADLLSYAVAKATAQSDAWKHAGRDTAYFAYDGTNFYMNGSAGSTTDWVAVTINLPLPGKFSGKLLYDVCPTSSPAKVYIAPVGTDSDAAMTDENLVFELSDSGSVSESKKDLLLPAGEHTVWVQQNAAEADDSIVILKNLKFTKIGEIPVDSVSISGAPDSMDIGKTATLTASVSPTVASQEVTWSSSSGKRATVKDGVVTAKKPGLVTITATSVSDPSVSASVDIKILGSDGYVFDFLGTAAASAAAHNSTAQEIVKTLDTHMTYAHAAAAGSDPLRFKGRLDYGANNNWSQYRYYTTTDINGNACAMFLVYTPYNQKSAGLFEIQIDEPGVYSAELFYSSYYSNYNTTGALYITPTTVTTVAAAETAANLLINIPDADANKVTKGHVVKANHTVTLEAGTYNLWYITDAPNNNASLGYAPIDTLKLHKAINGKVSTVDGAQIRTKGKQGLRFISSIDKSLIEQNNVVSYGTLLLPTADLDGDLVIGYANNANGHSAVQVEAKNIYAETDDTLSFTAVLTDIKPANYTRQISARAYAVLANGTVVYSETTTSRSIYQIAKAIAADPNASASDKAVAEEIISAVEG